jgi:transposase
MAKDCNEFAALIGMDWSDTKHDICIYCHENQTFDSSVLKHQPEAIDAWAKDLQKRFCGKPIAVCLEQKRGPLIYALCKYDFLVLFPVNPQTVAKYRQAFAPSRAKDDPTDALVLVELLLKHRDKLQPWYPASAEVRKLQQLVEWRRKLVAETVRTTNRLTDVLKSYFPQALECFEHRNTMVFCDFLTQWPTLMAVQKISDEELHQFFVNHNSRYAQCNARRIEQFRQAIALTTDPAIVEPALLMVEVLVSHLRTLIQSARRFEHAIQELFEQFPDADLFAALPGAGPNLAPRLFLAFGEDRDRYSCAQDLLQYAGIAPVTERSGKKQWVHWRWGCPTFLRQTFVEWANESRKFSFWANTFYLIQKQAGKTHQAAIRALAFKWIRILYRCWQDRKPYDEAKYLLALKKKGSPLVTQLAISG